ncbi:hypothetical protein JCM6882_009177 [Rhodosporidiobolus microsporus]
MADSPPAPLSASATAPGTLDERVAAYATNVLPSDYTFDPALSVDDNFLVLILIYARLSMSKRGNMACIIVDPITVPAVTADVEVEPPAKRARTSSPSPSSPSSAFPNYPGRIRAHSNNFPQPVSVSSDAPSTSPTANLPVALKKKNRTPATPKANQSLFLSKASSAPEIHAEARSICLAAASGVPLAGSTAYVSFPPCQACLPLLVAAGVKRLVYRQTMTAQACVELCRREGVECVEVVGKERDEELKRRAGEWWKSKGEGRDETRARLERWWKEQERVVMGTVEGPAVGGAGDAVEGEEKVAEGQGKVASPAAGAP